ncbi:hypothetical protein ACFV5E_15450 [Streptomyces chartreusis]|uniref:hypothetical protein n=1 Tax=Streptomyces chartreusis TaxID=1969 RepID=UPI00368E7E22
MHSQDPMLASPSRQTPQGVRAVGPGWRPLLLRLHEQLADTCRAIGVIRDRARILFREIEKALEDTDAGDACRMQLADMRRRYDLGGEPLQPVPDYDNFKVEPAALRYQERLAHQDRPQEPVTPTELPVGEPAVAATIKRAQPQLTSAEAPATSTAANGSSAG